MDTPPRVVSCPACGKPVTWSAQSPFRPFCSERCRIVDLGAWASERYRVAEQGARPDPAEPPVAGD
ncbi:MAG TPA: DNA gyrase inhibitor YacG [Rhodocyclaceae bacterium]|nr:MAG: DNA gyrase inhibitor YacG [Rhodocyclales bacterium CG17_big_fil_post_rev_8_21_14_2_50_68_7]PIX74990.1 MAG: DNA gyrase inhibitor YacG [Rhodocyclales bacterium CG_4_10_14_3_um_filter_68_10]PJA58541.1 MAG: DNA gyrase inhibitor YacG [Rhodocyclales bacterium CG_4_9_14_3_um_filter_68_10]HCX33295.1 DNA gyrase inhibitor YacG [Rhodocyclaceae bacterium]